MGSEPYGLCQLSKWTKGVRSPLLVRYTMFINQRETPMTHLAHAKQIGTEIIREGLSYCEDDNTYTPYTITMKAWACPVALCSPLTSARPLTAEELFTEMFGD